MIASPTQRHEADGTPDAADPARRPAQDAVEAALAENHREFLRFLRRRLGDRSAAEDVFQVFCLRAVSRRAALRSSDSVVAWLYSVLRSVLNDHYRSEAARRRREVGYAREQIALRGAPSAPEAGERICTCVHEVLPAMRPEYAEVLRRIDLSGESRERVADDLGIAPTNLRVRLHRARQALRKALAARCGGCCAQGFRDCSCGEGHGHRGPTPPDQAARF